MSKEDAVERRPSAGMCGSTTGAPVTELQTRIEWGSTLECDENQPPLGISDPQGPPDDGGDPPSLGQGHKPDLSATSVCEYLELSGFYDNIVDLDKPTLMKEIATLRSLDQYVIRAWLKQDYAPAYVYGFEKMAKTLEFASLDKVRMKIKCNLESGNLFADDDDPGLIAAATSSTWYWDILDWITGKFKAITSALRLDVAWENVKAFFISILDTVKTTFDGVRKRIVNTIKRTIIVCVGLSVVAVMCGVLLADGIAGILQYLATSLLGSAEWIRTRFGDGLKEYAMKSYDVRSELCNKAFKELGTICTIYEDTGLHRTKLVTSLVDCTKQFGRFSMIEPKDAFLRFFSSVFENMDPGKIELIEKAVFEIETVQGTDKGYGHAVRMVGTNRNLECSAEYAGPGQGAAPPFAVLFGLIGCYFTGSMPTSSDKAEWLTFFRMQTGMTFASLGIIKLVDVLIKLFPSTLIFWIRKKLGLSVGSVCEGMDLVTYADKIINAMYAGIDADKDEQIHALYELQDHIVERMKVNCDNSAVISLLGRKYTEIGCLAYNLSVSSGKTEPYHIWLWGKPGTGKSTSVELFANLLSKLKPKNKRPTLHKVAAQEDGFWNGFINAQTLWFDDPGRSNTPATDTLVESLSDLIGSGSFTVPQAALESSHAGMGKGAKATPDFVISTSNESHPRFPAIKDVKTFWRRRHLVLEVRPKKEWRNNNGQLDESVVATTPDTWIKTLHHLEFRHWLPVDCNSASSGWIDASLVFKKIKSDLEMRKNVASKFHVRKDDTDFRDILKCAPWRSTYASMNTATRAIRAKLVNMHGLTELEQRQQMLEIKNGSKQENIAQAVVSYSQMDCVDLSVLALAYEVLGVKVTLPKEKELGMDITPPSDDMLSMLLDSTPSVSDLPNPEGPCYLSQLFEVDEPVSHTFAWSLAFGTMGAVLCTFIPWLSQPVTTVTDEEAAIHFASANASADEKTPRTKHHRTSMRQGEYTRFASGGNSTHANTVAVSCECGVRQYGTMITQDILWTNMHAFRPGHCDYPCLSVMTRDEEYVYTPTEYTTRTFKDSPDLLEFTLSKPIVGMKSITIRPIPEGCFKKQGVFGQIGLMDVPVGGRVSPMHVTVSNGQRFSDSTILHNPVRVGDCGSPVYITAPFRQFIGIVFATNATYGYSCVTKLPGYYVDPTDSTGDAVFASNETSSQNSKGLFERLHDAGKDVHRVPTKERVYMPPNTMYQPGLLPDFPCPKQPAILSQRDLRNENHIPPAEASFCRFLDSKPIEFRDVQDSVDDVSSYYKKHLTEVYGAKVIGLKEAVVGIPGVVDSLDLKTSAGFPYRMYGIGKRIWIDSNEDGTVDCHEFFMKRYRACQDYLCTAVSALTNEFNVVDICSQDSLAYLDTIYHVGALKDELVAKNKIDEIRTRIVFSSPLEITVLNKQFCAYLLAMFQRSWDRTGVLTGCNMGSMDLTFVKDYLDHVGDQDEYYCGDFKGWDTNLPSWMLEAAITIVGNLMREYYKGFTTTQMLKFISLQSLSIRPRLQIGDCRAKVENGLVSGWYLTNLVGSVVNHLLFSMWTKSCGITEDFGEAIRVVVCGDDNLWKVRECYKDTLTPTKFRDFVKELGMDYTSDIKTEKLSDEPRSWNTITILGCTPVPYNDSWIGKMRYESIQGLLKYTTKTRCVVENVEEVLDFLATYDSKTFEEIRGKLLLSVIDPQAKAILRAADQTHIRDVVAKRTTLSLCTFASDFSEATGPAGTGSDPMNAKTANVVSDDVTPTQSMPVQPRIAEGAETGIAVTPLPTQQGISQVVQATFGKEATASRIGPTVEGTSLTFQDTGDFDLTIGTRSFVRAFGGTIGNQINFQVSYPFEFVQGIVPGVGVPLNTVPFRAAAFGHGTGTVALIINGVPQASGFGIFGASPAGGVSNRTAMANDIAKNVFFDGNRRFEISVPFVNNVTASNTYAGYDLNETDENFWNIYLYVYGISSATSIPYSVWIRFDDWVFTIPRTLVDESVSEQLRRKTTEFAGGRQSTSTVTYNIGGNSSIKDTTLDAGGGANSSGQNSASLDVEAPIPLHARERIGEGIQNYLTVGTMATSDETRMVQTMGMACSEINLVYPFEPGKSPTDIDNITSRLVLSETINVGTATPTGDPIFTFELSCDPYAGRNYMDDIARTFCFCRPEFEVYMVFAGSQFHTMDFYASLSYGAPAPVPYGSASSLYNSSFRADGKYKMFRFHIPYQSSRPYILANGRSITSDPVQRGTLGYFQIYANGPLIAPSNVDQNVDIHIFTAGRGGWYVPRPSTRAINLPFLETVEEEPVDEVDQAKTTVFASGTPDAIETSIPMAPGHGKNRKMLGTEKMPMNTPITDVMMLCRRYKGPFPTLGSINRLYPFVFGPDAPNRDMVNFFGGFKGGLNLKFISNDGSNFLFRYFPGSAGNQVNGLAYAPAGTEYFNITAQAVSRFGVLDVHIPWMYESMFVKSLNIFGSTTVIAFGGFGLYTPDGRSEAENVSMYISIADDGVYGRFQARDPVQFEENTRRYDLQEAFASRARPDRSQR